MSSSRRLTAGAILLALTALTGCSQLGAHSVRLGNPAGRTAAPSPDTDATRAARPVPAADQAVPTSTATTAAPAPGRLVGLGPHFLTAIPADSGQVLLVTGSGRDSSTATAVLYQRSEAGWQPGATWAAHNGHDGWTADHRLNDHRSPVGVFGLTDAGGRLPAPESLLPYSRSNSFTVSGQGFNGEPLAGAFDYVVAINYNRVPGTSPLDRTKPLGTDRGGGIWVHVDHGGPTHACVSLSADHMKELLHTLDPARHPVIAMGDAASLAA
ncbi:hypothetical protein [Kitasatospora sp. NPDC101183]|uniref:hypothetical protein n=1 Tax=Kitasatospora sp. NPDC101183 TaxID=3364100 RepID=UPI0038077E9D